VRKFIPSPLRTQTIAAIIGIDHEQGTFKTIGWKNNQPIDGASDREMVSIQTLTSKVKPLSEASGNGLGNHLARPLSASTEAALVRRI
jgi:hypothetical protein